MDIRNLFIAYWETLDQHAKFFDLGMGMPSPDLFAPWLDFKDAFNQGMHHRADYQPQAGAFTARQGIAAYETKRTGISYTAENVMFVAGALRGFSLILDNLIHTTANIIEIVPTYTLLAGHARNTADRINTNVITIIPQDKSCFTFEADEILPYISPSSITYITNPSNPTGLYISTRTLQQIATTCEKQNAYMVVDESCDIPLTESNLHDKIDSPSLIRICGLSKNILLAGFRAAYLVADAQIIRKLSCYSAFSDGNAPPVVNDVILSYIQHPEILPQVTNTIHAMVRDATDELMQIPGVEHIIQPEACYYILMKVHYSAGSWNLFKYLLNKGVNVVPGVLFGIDDHEAWIRICCARDAEVLTEGLNRIKIALATL